MNLWGLVALIVFTKVFLIIVEIFIEWLMPDRNSVLIDFTKIFKKKEHNDRV